MIVFFGISEIAIATGIIFSKRKGGIIMPRAVAASRIGKLVRLQMEKAWGGSTADFGRDLELKAQERSRDLQGRL